MANHRPIFRLDAIRRYVQSQQKTVLPRFIGPRTFVYLWIVLGFLFLAGGIVNSRLEVVFMIGQPNGAFR